MDLSLLIVTEAVCYLKQKGFGHLMGVHIDLITSDVLDHYRTYSLIERLLHAPTKMLEQSCFQLELEAREMIIEKYTLIYYKLMIINSTLFRYYSIDDAVAREILGKKLTSRYRKDLDEVSEKTGVKLKSCRRQFDNVKRIFKAVEELPGNLTNNIKQIFSLPDELAK